MLRLILLVVMTLLAGCRVAQVTIDHAPSGLHVAAKVER